MLGKLPDLTLFKICSYLSLHDLLSLRCTRFQLHEVVTSDSSLWKNFRVFTPRAFDNLEKENRYCDSIVSFASSIPKNSITEINWRVSPSLSTYLFRLLRVSSQSLLYLQVHSEEMTDALVELICEHLPSQLLHLGLTGSREITDRVLTHVLKSNCRLTSIDFSFDYLLSSDAFTHFVKNITSSLKSVVLKDVNDIADYAVRDLILKHGSTLEYLHVDGEKMTDSIFRDIANCPNLSGVVVDFATSFTDAIFPELAKLKGLVELSLRKGRYLTSQGFDNFVRLANLSKLQKLNLSECELLENGNVKRLAECCPNLTHLHIAWCTQIDDVGIGAVINKCHKMVDMDLSGLHELEGQDFALIPFSMPNLRKMKLEMSGGVDDGDLHWIVIQMKGQLEVIDFYHQYIIYDPVNSRRLITSFESSEALLSMSASENVTLSSVELESETTNTVETSEPPSTLGSHEEGNQTPRGESYEDNSSVMEEEVTTTSSSSSDEENDDHESDDQWETDNDSTNNSMDNERADVSKSSVEVPNENEVETSTSVNGDDHPFDCSSLEEGTSVSVVGDMPRSRKHRRKCCRHVQV